MKYKIDTPELPDTFSRYGISIDGKEIGWIRHNDKYQPIAYIYPEHTIDKEELAKAISSKLFHHRGQSAFFLVTENYVPLNQRAKVPLTDCLTKTGDEK